MADVTPKAYINSWAISVLSSRTMWFNAANLLVAVLALTEVAALVPVRFLQLQAAIVAAINLWLRTATTRPVAFIGQGETTVVPVLKIDPPAPPPITDYSTSPHKEGQSWTTTTTFPEPTTRPRVQIHAGRPPVPASRRRSRRSTNRPRHSRRSKRIGAVRWHHWAAPTGKG